MSVKNKSKIFNDYYTVAFKMNIGNKQKSKLKSKSTTIPTKDSCHTIKSFLDCQNCVIDRSLVELVELCVL